MGSTLTEKQVTVGLDDVRSLTDDIAEHQRQAVALGEERRRLMLTLNREGMVSYRRLARVTDLTLSRIIDQLKKAREELGIDAPHPRGSSPNGA